MRTRSEVAPDNRFQTTSYRRCPRPVSQSLGVIPGKALATGCGVVDGRPPPPRSGWRRPRDAFRPRPGPRKHGSMTSTFRSWVPPR